MDAPIRFLDTDQIAPDTYVIRQLMGEGVAPVAVHMNSMVITGREPVIVDTGAAITSDGWIERAFELVDPADVRWIFLSHDDTDHTGSLLRVLEMAPNATLVTNWFSVERMSADHLLPLDRMRWVNDGESFSVGDRELLAVTPPTFDSPTTRGLYDPKTGVYWASDSFAAPVPYEVSNIDELDPEFFQGGFHQFQTMVSPWVQWLDEAKYNAHLDRVEALGAKVVAGAHAITLRYAQVGAAFELLRQLPSLPPVQWPAQADLDAMLAAMTAAPAA
jgi:flavorubredoxin